jgi:hypothetical protein
MIHRPKTWLVVTLLFSLVNAAGAVMAAMQAEVVHAATHFALLVAGACAVWYIWVRSVPIAPALMPPVELDGKLSHLEGSIEDVVTQVERLGEGQRYINSFFADRNKTTARADVIPPAENAARVDSREGLDG